MLDLFFVVTASGLFALVIAYTYGCQRLRGGNHD
jgi:hypothetical protein